MDSFLVVALVALPVLSALLVALLYARRALRDHRRRLAQRVRKKLSETGVAVVALRVVDGSQEGLRGHRWFGGMVSLTPGRVEFTMWVGGLPLVKRPIPPIEVTAVGTAGPVRGLDRIKLIYPGYQMARLQSGLP